MPLGYQIYAQYSPLPCYPYPALVCGRYVFACNHLPPGIGILRMLAIGRCSWNLLIRKGKRLFAIALAVRIQYARPVEQEARTKSPIGNENL